MILQNLAKAIREQNWFAVVLEFLIVIAGVVIGFQIQGWSEGRTTQAAEASYLLSLQEDVTSAIAVLETESDRLEAQTTALEQLFQIHRGQEAMPEEDELSSLLLHGVFYLGAVEVGLPTYQSMKSSGALNLLGDQSVTLALQQIENEIERARNQLNYDFQATYQFSDPFLIEHADMAIAFASGESYLKRMDWLRDIEPREELSYEWIFDLQFGNALLYRANFSTSSLEIVEDLLARFRLLETLIAERSAQLGYAP